MSNQQSTFSEDPYVIYVRMDDLAHFEFTPYVRNVPTGDLADFDALSAAIDSGEAKVIRTRRKGSGDEVSLIVVSELVGNCVRFIPIAEIVGLKEEYEEPEVLSC